LIGQVQLRPDQEIAGVCRAQRPTRFVFDLAAGKTARIEVDQPESDLSVRTYSGNVTRLLDEADFATEQVTIVATSTARYNVSIAPVGKNVAQARFSIRLRIRESRPSDTQWIAAEDLATESKALSSDPSRWQQALALTRQSVDAWLAIGQQDYAAHELLKSASIWWRQGKLDTARSEYKQAELLCANSRCRAEALTNAALAGINTDVEESVAELERARAIWRELRLPLMEGSAALNLGLALGQMSEWSPALQQYRDALRLFGNRKPLSAARLYNNVGLIYLATGDYGKAKLRFERALRIASSQPDANDVRGRIRINLGRTEMLAGSLSSALRDEDAAILLLHANKSSRAEALNNKAQVLIQLSRFSESEDLLKESRALYLEIGDLRGMSSIDHQSALIAAKQGRCNDARELFELALGVRKERWLRNEASETLYQWSILEEACHDRDGARRRIEEAIELSEVLRTRLGGEPLRRSYFAGKQKYREFYIRLLLADHPAESWIDKAFEAAENSRHALLDLLLEDRPSSLRVDPGLDRQRTSVRRRLNALSYRLAAIRETATSATEIANVRREAEVLLAREAELDSLIASQDAAGMEIRKPRPLSTTEAHALLSASDAIYEFFLGDEQSFVWKVRRQSMQVEELPARSVIEKQVRLLVELLPQVNERRRDEGKQKTFNAARRNLADLLRLSFEDGNRPSRILIVPDGALNRLPFGVLMVREPPARGKVRRASLGLVAELLQVPSVSVFRVLQARQVSIGASSSVFTLADPVFSRQDRRLSDRIGPGRDATPDRRLSRLSAFQSEIATIERLVPSARRQIKLGFQATKAALLNKEAWDHSLILLSTHAFADDLQPELGSRIVLSLYSENGSAVDGFLHLNDLNEIELKSPLVIISACETIHGKVDRGEGLVGIATSFLRAGASGVLASPVRLDDEGAAAFGNAYLQSFLGPLQPSASRAALEARCALARSSRWNDPSYWGSLILISGF